MVQRFSNMGRFATAWQAFLFSVFSWSFTIAEEPAQVVWRTPLEEVGQSGVCLQGDNLYLAIHTKLPRAKGGLVKSSDIVGQHPEVVAKMGEFYGKWWEQVGLRLGDRW